MRPHSPFDSSKKAGVREAKCKYKRNYIHRKKKLYNINKQSELVFLNSSLPSLPPSSTSSWVPLLPTVSCWPWKNICPGMTSSRSPPHWWVLQACWEWGRKMKKMMSIAGRDRVLLPGHLRSGVYGQSHRYGVLLTQRIISTKCLEHYGLYRSGQWVSFRWWSY